MGATVLPFNFSQKYSQPILKEDFTVELGVRGETPEHGLGGGGGGRCKAPRNGSQESHAWPSRLREAKRARAWLSGATMFPGL